MCRNARQFGHINQVRSPTVVVGVARPFCDVCDGGRRGRGLSIGAAAEGGRRTSTPSQREFPWAPHCTGSPHSLQLSTQSVQIKNQKVIVLEYRMLSTRLSRTVRMMKLVLFLLL